MKGKFFLFVLYNFFCLSVLGQGKYVDSLKEWIKEHPQIDSQYILTLHRISYRLSEKDVNQSFAYYERVSQLSDSLNFTFGKSLAEINLGILLYNSGNLQASNNAFFKAVDYADTCKAKRLKAVAFNNIGENFRALHNYDKCREYAWQAIALNKEIQSFRGVAINYELLHECDLEQGLRNAAKNDLDIGLPFANLAGESYILAMYNLGFGKLQAINNHLDSADYYFKEAFREAALENDLRNEFFVYIARAKYMNPLPSTQKVALLNRALGIARETQYYEGISNTAELLSDVYDQQGNKDSSLKYYRVYRAAFDSLFSSNSRRNLIINEAQWVIKRKELENLRLVELSELQRRQIIFKDILLFGAFFLLLLTIIAAFFIYKNFQSKKKRTEFALRQKIAESRIQSLRSQMNPHFIFNSLNSIENFMMQNEKRKASDYLHKFALLIRTILESSHKEQIPFHMDMEALRLYVELEQMRFQDKFQAEFTVDPALEEGDFMVPALVIQPFVENAIVHGIAHSDNPHLLLKISASLESNFIRYIVEDNGVGRKQAASYQKINKLHQISLGLRITEDRIHLFNQEEPGTDNIKITDLYDKAGRPIGTRVEVHIKNK